MVVDPAVSGAFVLDASSPLAFFDARQIPLGITIEIVLKSLEIIPPHILEDRLNVPSHGHVMAALTLVVCEGEVVDASCACGRDGR